VEIKSLIKAAAVFGASLFKMSLLNFSVVFDIYRRRKHQQTLNERRLLN